MRAATSESLHGVTIMVGPVLGVCFQSRNAPDGRGRSREGFPRAVVPQRRSGRAASRRNRPAPPSRKRSHQRRTSGLGMPTPRVVPTGPWPVPRLKMMRAAGHVSAGSADPEVLLHSIRTPGPEPQRTLTIGSLPRESPDVGGKDGITRQERAVSSAADEPPDVLEVRVHVPCQPGLRRDEGVGTVPMTGTRCSGRDDGDNRLRSQTDVSWCVTRALAAYPTKRSCGNDCMTHDAQADAGTKPVRTRACTASFSVTARRRPTWRRRSRHGSEPGRRRETGDGLPGGIRLQLVHDRILGSFLIVRSCEAEGAGGDVVQGAPRYACMDGHACEHRQSMPLRVQIRLPGPWPGGGPRCQRGTEHSASRDRGGRVGNRLVESSRRVRGCSRTMCRRVAEAGRETVSG